MKKNKYTPTLISLAIAFASSLLLGGLSSILMYFKYSSIDLLVVVAILVSSFFLIFLMLQLYLRFYIYRNIGNILSNLSEQEEVTDSPVGGKFKEMGMENLNKKVRVWIDENKKEIDKYKILSDYRNQFLGDISHELKTPLFSIQGYLHTLIDGALHDKSKNKLFLERAIKSTERLESIISDLDKISRLETGEMSFNYSNFNIKEIFRDVFDDLDYMASQKQIKLSFKLDSINELLVSADSGQIRHVCSNLVANAIHYGKKGGFVKVGFYNEPDNILIEVSDNGIGIPEKHVVHLFDRFYRIDASRSRNKGGSGLGLSIVKHILNGHGQNITVKSVPGKGSTFRFTLQKQRLT